MSKERNPEQDLRQLGGMLFAVRIDDGKVWAMRDKKKSEECAGTTNTQFSRESGDAWCVPAGGRNGYETSKKTLIEETFEEAGIRLPDDANFEQLHPEHFLVDQVKDGKMMRLGVGVWMLKVTTGDDIERGLSENENGKWVTFHELRAALRNEEEAVKYRPQLLFAAAIASGLCDVTTIQNANKALIALDNELAQKNSWDLSKGVVDDDGLLTLDEAKEFLGLN